MQRRNFLQVLAALPFVGWLVPKKEVVAMVTTVAPTRTLRPPTAHSTKEILAYIEARQAEMKIEISADAAAYEEWLWTGNPKDFVPQFPRMI